ncbi:hypothetical protein [Streptomyces sp. NBC_01198]|uniref:hypothetical protein n=1 Tax=Streptomyces sp. NBC_01198 TaxID=2903769 RepID=UPI002E1156A5|nr:hypothetical protein OG702_32210 [Streptomyces sp. NBC_01198]
MSDAKILHLDTSELRKGDIVLSYGMRTRLDVETSKTPGVWHWEGTVLNLDEVLEEGFIPPSFLRTHKWEGGWVTDREDYWAVQGNELAFWSVERQEPV